MRIYFNVHQSKMAITSSEEALYPQGDPSPAPMLEFEEALLCRGEEEYFHSWALIFRLCRWPA